MPKKPFMDVLGSDSEEESGDGDAAAAGSKKEGDVEEGAVGGAGPPKKQKKEIDLETLQRLGYKSGPSVLFVPPPKPDADAGSWHWDDGKAAKQAEVAAGDESREAREANRAAATTGAEEAARLSYLAAAHAAALREARRQEQQEMAASKNLKWKDKEKRKRAEGKVSRGGSYVEEEKRRGREFGMYSGFD